MANGVQWTPELGELICERMAEGETLAAILAGPGMPTYRTVRRWCERDDLLLADGCTPFSERYEEARVDQCHKWADDIVRLSQPELTGTNRDTAIVQKARLEVDAKRWVVGRLLSGVYGDKVTHKGDELTPITVVVRSFGEGEEKGGEKAAQPSKDSAPAQRARTLDSTAS